MSVYRLHEFSPHLSADVADLTDDGLALGFSESRPEYRRVHRWGQWRRWNGQVWEEDSTLKLFSDVREFLRALAQAEPDESNQKRLRSASTVAAVERLAQSDRRYAATVDQWDRNPWLLNTPSGVLNLRSGAMEAHDPEIYMTKLTAVGVAKECPLWMEFLSDVTDGNGELIGFLQRVAGYCLTGDTSEHALFFLYGTGGNGKSVFLNALLGVLGDYARIAPMETFTEQTGERHPCDLAMLQGARLAIAQETDEGRRWAESRIKALTGGDPITARYMRQDFFTFQPQFKLLIAGNHKPRITAADEALRRRLHLIPFVVTIPAERRDPALPEKLRAEWPAILNWALAGCLDYQSVGLRPPEIVLSATAAYFDNQDTFGDWLATRCRQGADTWDTPSALYRSWSQFAELIGERPGRQREFTDRMEGRGFRQGRDNARGRYWLGVTVKSDTTNSGECGP